MSRRDSPVGIFGGTFDPVHFGHLRLAQEIAEHCGMSEVRIVPAGIPPHRNQPHCAASHRLEMVRIAIRGNPLFFADPLEVEKQTPCYSVESLECFRETHGRDRPLCLMVGADAFLGLHTWHRWREIFGLAHVVMARRPGFDIHRAMHAELGEEFKNRLASGPEALRAAPCGMILPVDITLLDISSSKIRTCLGEGRSARYLVPDGVLRHIETQILYRKLNGR